MNLPKSASFMALVYAGVTLTLMTKTTVVVDASVHSYVNIHMPGHLHQADGGYDHRLGSFGNNAIGGGSHRYYGSVAMQLIDAETDMCHNGDTRVDESRPHPFMLLASRGNCTYVTKARHAQQAGAAGLVISDNTCLCSDGCNVTTDSSPCELEMPSVADDGSGGDVSIPVILLREVDVAPILKTFHADKRLVLLDLKWHPKAITEDHKLYFGMWVDLHDNHTASLMQSVKPLALSLAHSQKESHAQFYPGFQFYSGQEIDCVGNTVSKDQCWQTCTNNGRYCYPSKHGVQVVTEILHRICIWDHHGQSTERNDDGTVWWDYVTYYDEYCRQHWFEADLNKGDEELIKCIEKAYKHTKIKEDEVKLCISDSGTLTGEANNTKLDEQLKQQRDYGLMTAPTVWSNGGSLHWRPPTASSIFSTVCDQYHSDDKTITGGGDVGGPAPKVCQVCNAHPGDGSDKAILKCAQKFYGKHGSKHRFWRGIKVCFWIVFWVALVGGGAYFLYRKFLQGREGDRLGVLSDGLRYAMLSDENNADTVS